MPFPHCRSIFVFDYLPSGFVVVFIIPKLLTWPLVISASVGLYMRNRPIVETVTIVLYLGAVFLIRDTKEGIPIVDR